MGSAFSSNNSKKQKNQQFMDSFRNGVQSQRLGDMQKALELYTECIWHNHKFLPAYYNRAGVYRSLKKYALALEDYNSVISLRPDASVAYYGRANIYRDIGKGDLALSDYNKAIEIYPGFAKAYNNRGQLYRQLGQHERAMEDYEKASSLEPALTEAMLNIKSMTELPPSSRLSPRPSPEGGIPIMNPDERYDKKAKMELQIRTKDIAKAYFKRGLFLNNINDSERAIEDYNTAISLDPTFRDAYNNRGLIYYERRQLDLALQDYSKAIQLDPNFAYAYNNRAHLYKERRDDKKAIQDYDKTLSINPTISVAYYGRGLVYTDLFEKQKALFDLNKCIELAPRDPRFLCARATFYIKFEYESKFYLRDIFLAKRFAEKEAYVPLTTKEEVRSIERLIKQYEGQLLEMEATSELRNGGPSIQAVFEESSFPIIEEIPPPKTSRNLGTLSKSRIL